MFLQVKLLCSSFATTFVPDMSFLLQKILLLKIITLQKGLNTKAYEIVREDFNFSVYLELYCFSNTIISYKT